MRRLDFSDLEPVQIPFSYKGQDYILREASGRAANVFNNERSRRIVYNENGKLAGLRDIADLGLILLQECVFEAGTGKAVSKETMASWPARMVEELFEAAKEISHMHDEKGVWPSFREAMTREGSPIKYDELVEYIDSLPSDEFGKVQRAIDRHQTPGEQ